MDHALQGSVVRQQHRAIGKQHQVGRAKTETLQFIPDALFDLAQRR